MGPPRRSAKNALHYVTLDRGLTSLEIASKATRKLLILQSGQKRQHRRKPVPVRPPDPARRSDLFILGGGPQGHETFLSSDPGIWFELPARAWTGCGLPLRQHIEYGCLAYGLQANDSRVHINI